MAEDKSLTQEEIDEIISKETGTDKSSGGVTKATSDGDTNDKPAEKLASIPKTERESVRRRPALVLPTRRSLLKSPSTSKGAVMIGGAKDGRYNDGNNPEHPLLGNYVLLTFDLRSGSIKESRNLLILDF